MSRLALYRKWRPMTFEDVVEQRHVVETLRNALKSDAVGHAYLFCGTRGTGKTTMAKIFARALNCLNPHNGDPCNECAICKGILEGSILDVMEMDAASNNSVDNIRDIRDEVVYAPAVARYKVYIIDEVHMLSQGAFNALLKTLEEPPDRVVFILATTEPQKLPATVLSRCQRFDFKRITEQGIADRLGEIAADCGISVSEPALRLLSRLAGGAMRDAISLLDQLTTLGRTEIDVSDVNEMAGFASNAAIRQLAGALLAGDIAASWTALDDLMREGRDLSQLCVQLLGWFRNALLLQLGGESSPLLDLHPDDMADARRVAQTLTTGELSNWLRALSEHELRLRRTDNPRIMMEVLLLRLCTRTAGDAGVGAGGVAAVGSSAQAAQPANPVQGAQPSMQPVPSVQSTQLVQPMQSVQSIQPAQPMQSVQPTQPAQPTPSVPPAQPVPSVQAVQAVPPAMAPPTAPPASQPAGPAADTAAGGVSAFAPWSNVIDEVRRMGPSRPGGMKLFAYLLDSECLMLADRQLRVVVPADDFLRRKVLSQSDSLEMMVQAVRQVTGEVWKIRIIDAKEAASLTGAPHRQKGKSVPTGQPTAVPTGQATAVPTGQATVVSTGQATAVPTGQETAVPTGEAPAASTGQGFAVLTGEASGESVEQTSDVPTGDEALDKLMQFARETGFPVQVDEGPEE